ncbi:LexA family protein [Paludibacterium yongneupense]|uniref:LexA family protein n=1 Tax=Paludibacterium yongneupense TaxID=400061 RepID=UPI0004027599|nr:translesion error-prone DNA polymerase V autoproteolytic subunit [Paludibacterium yongneupense]
MLKKHGGSRPGAGRPAGSGRIQTGEALTQLRIPVADKSAVIDLVQRRQAQRLAAPPAPPHWLPAAAPHALHLPLFASGVRAGFPSPADDYVEDRIDLNSYLIEDGPATFMVRVEGDSMIGAGIFDGDLLVVDKGRTPVQFDIVVAALDGEFTVKRLDRRGGRIVLQAENPAFPPIIPSYEQEFMIWGVVTACVRKF